MIIIITINNSNVNVKNNFIFMFLTNQFHHKQRRRFKLTHTLKIFLFLRPFHLAKIKKIQYTLDYKNP